MISESRPGDNPPKSREGSEAGSWRLAAGSDRNLRHSHCTLVISQTMHTSGMEINWLGLIGGAGVNNCTWRILKRVIVNSLVKNLNWSRINGKTVATLQLKEVVIELLFNTTVQRKKKTDVQTLK
ncbi:hypothetical protein ROHU_009662 [Labeo rohita]|uniref:Uncharacterized protein n=1 Tax=Labeo rohita TaxID=84645 RepID=A0A498M0X2_LABRO|nr:hypothetical protein ROHU_009662 [Labeo rohita]